ncbi:hypothetical protein GQ607_017481, partial [Colletotrichum asianum]
LLSKLVDDALFLFAAAVLPKPAGNHLVTVRSTHPLKINTIESTTNHACHHIPPPPPPIAHPPRTSTLRRPSAPPSVTVGSGCRCPVMANRRGNRGPAARLVGAGVGQAGLGTSARANAEQY